MLPIPSVSDNDNRQASDRNFVSVQVTKERTGVRGGFDLVTRCVHPETGRIDTKRLACWVSDAATRDLEAAARAYGALEAQLLARSPGDVARFNQDLVEAFRAASQRRERFRADSPLLTRWAPALPAESVATAGLRALLARYGIEF